VERASVVGDARNLTNEDSIAQTKSQEGRRLTQVKRCQLEPGEQDLRAVKTESRESAGSSGEAPGRMNSLKGKHPGG
jgi:hypothetical protein